jgi:hypothetical protein
VKRLAIWSLVCLAAACLFATLTILLAPTFSSDPVALPALSDARGTLGMVLGNNFTVLAGWLVLALIWTLIHKLGGRVTLPSWINFNYVFLAPFVLWNVLGIGYAFLQFLAAPKGQQVRFTHLGAVHIHSLGFVSWTGPAFLANNHQRVVVNDSFTPHDGFVALKDNVMWISARNHQLVFPQPIAEVGDIHYREHTLLIISGDRLYSVHDNDSNVAWVAQLPIEGMRFGQRAKVLGLGADSALLLTGNKGENGAVFELRATGEYSKLADTEQKVVGAAGCSTKTAIAFDNEIIQVEPGYKPVTIFRVPQGVGPVTSVLARYDKDCIYLVAVRDGVFLIQRGAAYLLVAGLGGNLFAPEDTLYDFVLTDPVRNAAVIVRFTRPGEMVSNPSP